MLKGATFSNCKRYRYELFRLWDASKPIVMFIMFNPSVADEEIDDATIRRCIGFARDWGYGGIEVCNLYAYRSTKPEALLNTIDPIGVENTAHIKKIAEQADLIVCAWGNSTIGNKLMKNLKHDYKPLSGLDKLHFIELAIDGTPKHQLYLPKHLKPQPYFPIKTAIVNEQLL